MESEWRAWADLPAELLAKISGSQETWDMTGFRGVCRSWRSSVMTIPNKISPLFPHTLSPFCGHRCFQFKCPHHHYLFAINAVYLLRSKDNPGSCWIVSVQESEPGKLLLRHPLTYEPIPGFSGLGLDMSSGLSTLTRLSISHSFHSICLLCPTFAAHTKLLLFPNPADDGNYMALFDYQRRGRLRALRRCLSNAPAGQLVAQDSIRVQDFVDFNGCIYAVDFRGVVYLLDDFQLLRLTCVNSPDSRWKSVVWKRFVVSDGDLYLVFNFCTTSPHQQCDYYEVYKLVMNDICYNLERVENLGDKVFFINNDCSFSVSARDLPPPLVGNCILVARSGILNCRCFSGFIVYHLGGMASTPHPQKHDYSALFFKHSNQLQLQKVVSKIERKRKKNKRTREQENK